MSNLKKLFQKRNFLNKCLMMLLDASLTLFALWLSFSLRLGNLYIPPAEQYPLFFSICIIAIPIFYYFGLYHTLLRYASVDLIWGIVKSATAVVLVWSLMAVMLSLPGIIPRSIFGIFWFTLIPLVGGYRFILRTLHWRTTKGETKYVIYGAGNAGTQMARVLRYTPGVRAVGFLDDNRSIQGSLVAGLCVYKKDDLTKLLRAHGKLEILIALPSASHVQRARLIKYFEQFKVRVRTLPNLEDIAHGKIQYHHIREVEIDDLLGREPIMPDYNVLKGAIQNKNILVTGAGGSVGTEICLQIIALQPQSLIILDHSEHALYNVMQSLSGAIRPLQESGSRAVKIVPILSDVSNQPFLEHVIKSNHVDTIYHAAAYKHVPIVEENAIEGIRNNVFGTLSLAHAALNQSVPDVILISSDKAVRPCNVMGATKRISELILQSLQEYAATFGKHTSFVMVRFGNVLGSSGSIIPRFRNQIQHGGPVTVTHKEATRFFMTIQEATQLVIQAGQMGQGGEVFVLDMGSPVKIDELARTMIHLMGRSVKDEDNPEGDIEIDYIGLRPGEKLTEELLIGDNVSDTAHPYIMMAREHFTTWESLKQQLDALSTVLEQCDEQAALNYLSKIVKEYEMKERPNQVNESNQIVAETT